MFFTAFFFYTYSKTVTAINMVNPSNTPLFLFVSDSANYTERNNIYVNSTYLPDKITLFQDVKYVLHGRVYVTSRNGHHFYTVCCKLIDGRKCLVRIDNLHNSIPILTFGMDKDRTILQINDNYDGEPDINNQANTCTACDLKFKNARTLIGYMSQVHRKHLRNNIYIFFFENLTSQTCVFCFKKTTHPFKDLKTKNGTLVKEVRGTVVCSNKHCILALKHETHKGRDAVSATAICISGSAMLILKMQHPSFCYNDYNSETNTNDFRKTAEVFLNRNTSRPAIDDGITREI
ncbi:hypothetical protein EDC94DRAFT_597220 [Helicostylum pulchrum]|nr:hypothetical protein EDC94DRAFT_597220 [Helicostylum pulchrum]